MFFPKMKHKKEDEAEWNALNETLDELRMQATLRLPICRAATEGCLYRYRFAYFVTSFTMCVSSAGTLSISPAPSMASVLALMLSR